MREYMERLRKKGELLEIEREVQAKHQLAAITDQVQKKYDKPLLFHHVSGTQFPVLTSLYSNRKRLADILGIKPTDFCRKWNDLTNLGAQGNGPLVEEIAYPNDLIDLEVSDLPLITYSERDAGAYFTSAIYLAEEPETNVRNL